MCFSESHFVNSLFPDSNYKSKSFKIRNSCRNGASTQKTPRSLISEVPTVVLGMFDTVAVPW